MFSMAIRKPPSRTKSVLTASSPSALRVMLPVHSQNLPQAHIKQAYADPMCNGCLSEVMTIVHTSGNSHNTNQDWLSTKSPRVQSGTAC